MRLFLLIALLGAGITGLSIHRIEVEEALQSQVVERLEDRAVQIYRALLAVDEVQIKGNYHTSREEILSKIDLYPGDRFWRKSLSEMSKQIKSLDWVEEVDASWLVYPTRLELNVSEAEPWLVAQYQQKSWLISRRGNLVSPLESISDVDLIMEIAELPRLNGVDTASAEVSAAQSSSERLSSALEMIRLVDLAGGLGNKIERYELREDGSLELIAANSRQFPKVVIAPQSFGDTEKLLKRLKQVLDDLRSRGEQTQRIDLRFQQQVVISREKPSKKIKN